MKAVKNKKEKLLITCVTNFYINKVFPNYRKTKETQNKKSFLILNQPFVVLH